jgi:DNA helicase HerA-like ATPase
MAEFYEDIVKAYPTVVGRERKDLEKFGNIAAGYIGKHIVGKGEDAHLTTKVYLDFLKVHVILICGKRGSGKSYSASVLLEEFSFLPDEYRNKMSFIVVDPVGIYWSMKYPNEQQKNLLKEWQLEPKGLTNLKVLVPIGQLESYKNAGVPVDGTIALSLNELTPEEILLAFKLDRLSEEGVALEKNFTKLQREKEKFDLTDLIEEIRKDEETKKEVRDALVSLLSVANEWKLIVKEGTKIEEIAEPRKITVIDVSRMRSEELRNLLVALIAREIYRLRVLARKEEEKFKISGEKPKFIFPIVWLILEECLPYDTEIITSRGVLKIGKIVELQE